MHRRQITLLYVSLGDFNCSIYLGIYLLKIFYFIFLYLYKNYLFFLKINSLTINSIKFLYFVNRFILINV